MNFTLREKYDRIRKAAEPLSSRSPVEIAERLMQEEFVSMHGPEHHFLDGTAFLTAYRNAGGALDWKSATEELAARTEAMPGAMCGKWGVCGSVTAVGAAMSVLHGTGPLSTDSFYGDHMAFAAEVIRKMSEIGGARCCKRNAFLSLNEGARFVRERYGIPMETRDVVCHFSSRNSQCIGSRCPFHDKKK